MSIFKSTIRAKVMAHINPKIEAAEKEHAGLVNDIHADYFETVQKAAELRDTAKSAAEDYVVNKLIS